MLQAYVTSLRTKGPFLDVHCLPTESGGRRWIDPLITQHALQLLIWLLLSLSALAVPMSQPYINSDRGAISIVFKPKFGPTPSLASQTIATDQGAQLQCSAVMGWLCLRVQIRAAGCAACNFWWPCTGRHIAAVYLSVLLWRNQWACFAASPLYKLLTQLLWQQPS